MPSPELDGEFYETIYDGRSQRMSDRVVELLETEPDVTCFEVVVAVR